MKILILRFSSIGDVVLTSPVIRCLGEQLREAELHYLTKPAYAPLVQHNPHIARVHLLQEDWHTMVNALREEGFDLIVDLHKNLRSRRLSRALNVNTIRFDKLNIRKYLFTRFRIDLLPRLHLVDRYFNALEPLGIRNDRAGLEVHLSEERLRVPAQHGLTAGDYVVYALGGTYATKRLPNARIAALIRRIDRPVVLLGGPSDKENEDRILSEEGTEHAIGLSGKVDLLGSAAILRSASHVFCHDSGMMHIAAAFQRPMSVIWGNTHPALGMYAYGYGDDAPLFNYQRDLGCRPCSKLGHDRCPQGHFHCMQKHNVEDIVKKSLSVEQGQ